MATVFPNQPSRPVPYGCEYPRASRRVRRYRRNRGGTRDTFRARPETIRTARPQPGDRLTAFVVAREAPACRDDVSARVAIAPHSPGTSRRREPFRQAAGRRALAPRPDPETAGPDRAPGRYREIARRIRHRPRAFPHQ